MKIDWKDEFDKEEYWKLESNNHDTSKPIFTKVNRELKDFISQELAKQREDIIEMIEQMQYISDDLAGGYAVDAYDIINKLKEM